MTSPPAPSPERRGGEFPPLSFRESKGRLQGQGVRSLWDYAHYLLNAGYEKEFEKEINLLKRKYPNAVQPLMLHAEYYKSRDIIKSIEIFKIILARETSEDCACGAY